MKESTTRGHKRRRENDGDHPPRNPPAQSPAMSHPAPPAMAHMPAPSPAQSSTPSNPPSNNASPVAQPMRPPPPVAPITMNTARSTSTAKQPTLPWPMPTLAANTPSPVLTHNQIDTQQTSYYNRQQTQQAYSQSIPPTTNVTSFRPQSSHGNTTTPHHHPYMYRPNGTDSGRR